MWRPYLHKRVLYSEILDKFYSVTVTLRTMDQIDEHYGLDNYILKVSETVLVANSSGVYSDSSLACGF